MTLISLTDCCSLLAIDPKTLRRWLSLSHLSAKPHPHDARLKCLTHEQVQQLAATHHRTLETKAGLHVQPEISALPTRATNVGSAPTSPDIQSDGSVADAVPILHILGQLLGWLMRFRLIRKWAKPFASSAHIPDLMKHLAGLQAQVALLQDQLTLLTDQLQKQQWQTSQVGDSRGFSQQSSQDNSLESSQENSQHPSQDNSRGFSQENSLASSQEMSQQSSQDNSQESSQENSQGSSQEMSQEIQAALPPAHTPSIDRRKHPHVLPLVEYGAEGTYVVVCPERGMLECLPDSPEWFAWLSALPSFRFMGQLGRFTAHRGGSQSPTRGWRASRQIRNRSYNHPLGKTEDLTVAHLEQVAAILQSHLN